MHRNTPIKATIIILAIIIGITAWALIVRYLESETRLQRKNTPNVVDRSVEALETMAKQEKQQTELLRNR